MSEILVQPQFMASYINIKNDDQPVDWGVPYFQTRTKLLYKHDLFDNLEVFRTGLPKLRGFVLYDLYAHTQEKRYLIVFDLICFWLGFRYVWRCDKSHHKLICWLWNSKPAWISEVFSTLGIQTYNVLPVVPHKAVAEVSKIGNL